jgi:O-acetyl-ADP-ribose deacetylase (regulator of RNase III)
MINFGPETVCLPKDTVTAVARPVHVIQEKEEHISVGSVANSARSDINFEFSTNEGLKVKVYRTSIIYLAVDGIVNAANTSLCHGGGVALAISKAAGAKLNDECRAHVQEYGQVRVTENCVTTGGDMPCRHVIHAVGHIWKNYPSAKDRCLDDLCETVVNCLKKADDHHMATLAMPAISAGIFGVPKDKCAEMYILGAVKYSKQYGRSSAVENCTLLTLMSTCCDSFNLHTKNGRPTLAVSNRPRPFWNPTRKALSRVSRTFPIPCPCPVLNVPCRLPILKTPSQLPPWKGVLAQT